MIGVTHVVFGLLQGIRRRLARLIGIGKHRHQFTPLVGQLLRHAGEFEKGCAGFLGARRKLADLRIGPRGALVPLPGIGLDRLEAFGACLGLALQPVVPGAGLGVVGAVAIDVISRRRKVLLQAIESRKGCRLAFAGCKKNPRLAKRLFDAPLGFVERRGLGQPLRQLTLMAGKGAAGEFNGRHSRTRRFARLALAAHGLFDGGPGRFVCPTRIFGRPLRLGQFDFKASQPVAFSQSLGGRRRRIRRRRKSIPPPDIALARHQPLAGPQLRLQRLAKRLGNNTDVRESPLQGLRRIDETRQRFGTLRQGCNIFKRRQPAPVNRGRFVGGSINIVAKGRAKCRFITLLDIKRINQRRPQVAIAALQQIRQGAHFRGQLVGLAARLVMGLALVGLGLTEEAHQTFGLADRSLVGGQRVGGGFDGGNECGAIRRLAHLRQKRRALRSGIRRLALEARHAGAVFLDGAQNGVAPRR